MKIASIISSLLLVIWVVLTMVWMWTVNVLDTALYIKLSVTMAILVLATLLIALALKEYGTEKKLKDHNYLD